MVSHQFSVFIVDNNRVTARHLAHRLRRSGFTQIRHARSEAEALGLEPESGAPSIWILDSQLDDGSGIDLLDRLGRDGEGSRMAAIVSGSDPRGGGLTAAALQRGAMAVFTGDAARRHAAAWASNLATRWAARAAGRTPGACGPATDELVAPGATPPGAEDRRQVGNLLTLCLRADPQGALGWRRLGASAAQVARRLGLGWPEADWLELGVGLLALPALFARGAGGAAGQAALVRYGSDALLSADAALAGMSGRWARLGRELLQTQDELWDGSGGPLHLSGTRIPLSSRVLTLARIVDHAPGEAGLEALARACGGRADPGLARRYLAAERAAHTQRQPAWH